MGAVPSADNGSPDPGWTIIGVGSPVTGDDLGWLAIDALRMAGLDRVARLVALDRPGPSLIEYLERDVPAILIDAMQAGEPPGTVRDLEPEQLLARSRLPSSHSLGVAESLQLARALGCLPRRLHVIGIQPGPEDDGGAGWRAAALREVTRRVRDRVG